MFDGAYGELGATRRVRLATPKILLQQCAKDVRDLLHGWFPGRKPVEESFHGRLAAAALARLPRDLLDPGPAPPIPYVMMPGRPLGIVASYVKSQMAPTAVPGRTLRQIYPLRDRRIIELAAGLPAHFTVRDGHSRALVRAMLRGPLPDSIALRPKGGGFSPDYEQRLLRHAAAAEDRIALQSSCGAGEWLDLDWLQQGLRALACGRPAPVREMMRIQSTAIAAEFFVWWASPAVQRPPREPG